MMEFLRDVTLAQLAWLTVINYIVHYAEEGPRLAEWIETHCPVKNFTYTQKKLNLENLMYFGFLLIGVVLLNLYPGVLLYQAMVFSVAGAFVANTWFHARPTLTTAIYSPGVVSACVFNQIVLLLLLLKAHSLGILTIPLVVLSLILVVSIFPLIVHVAHNILLKDEQVWPWLEHFPVSRYQGTSPATGERDAEQNN